ncbi:NAD(P)/FAD-dependent oxidoreductase [Gordonia soli]|uniref:Rubredoxin reductase n=1 Tax=Gordonia soli NBRC 108243 TaxID=1223545 RepID=M0QDX7_9ACTN|nr:FAD-dependent oxidoreductase [Gordonia soli]GAC66649.1 rubredoxin reductase [Gordonia soli NBRC 108243]
MTRTVIVGTGIAGMTTAETLRSRGHIAPITVIGDEPGLPYRRTSLSKDIAGIVVDDDSFELRPAAHWADRDIEIRSGTAVADIDADRRSIGCDDGTRLDYDILVLATGGRSRSVDTIDAEVPTLRTRADAIGIHRLLHSADRLTVLGGGLIGLEVAASAARAGLDVWVVEAADRLMGRVVPAEVSALLLDLHRDRGVTVLTDTAVGRALPDRVTFADGTERTGAVISAVGTAPRTDLARRAGLDVTPAGVTVDACLRTSVSGIYAVGDVAAVPHAITSEPAALDHWMAATEQGAAVAATIVADLAGEPSEAHVAVPLAWTVQHGVNLQLAGWPGTGDRIEVDGDPDAHDATVWARHGDLVVGAVTIGRPAQGRRCRDQIREVVTKDRESRIAV